MSSVLGSVGRCKKAKRLGEVETVDRASWGLEPEAKVELIRGLIPLGLMQVQELLDEEVRSLAEERCAGGRLCGVRHRTNPGSVRLSGQRLPIRVPRVRGEEGEIPLRAHAGCGSSLS